MQLAKLFNYPMTDFNFGSLCDKVDYAIIWKANIWLCVCIMNIYCVMIFF